MTTEPTPVSVEFLRYFADAWNRHDVDDLMSFMTDDCIFETTGGDEAWGTRVCGSDAVRARFVDVWASLPDARWGDDSHFVSGDRGVSEWTFSGTRPDGQRIEVQGCDIFTFRDGRIAVKSTYFKNRPAIAG
jgi:steroid delta-isomerase-like uncharacterized protein